MTEYANLKLWILDAPEHATAEFFDRMLADIDKDETNYLVCPDINSSPVAVVIPYVTYQQLVAR